MALVIFDYSGVLANDLAVSWSIITNIIVSYGKKPDTIEEFQRRFKLPYEQYLVDKGFQRKAIPSLDIPSQFVRGYIKQMARINTFSDTVKCVRELSKRHTMVVLSSTPRSLVVKFLESNGIADCFERIYGHEDLGKEKPKPNPVLKILEEYGFHKKNTVMVGDMVQDIQSAKTAGVISVGFCTKDSYHTKESLLKEKPHHLISNLTELEGIVNRYNHHKQLHLFLWMAKEYFPYEDSCVYRLA